MKRCHRYAAEFLQRRVSTKTQQKHKDATFRNKGRDVNLNSTVLGKKSSKCMHNFKKITRRFPKWCLSAAEGSKNMILEPVWTPLFGHITFESSLFANFCQLVFYSIFFEWIYPLGNFFCRLNVIVDEKTWWEESKSRQARWRWRKCTPMLFALRVFDCQGPFVTHIMLC